jgi:hypothetical protein
MDCLYGQTESRHYRGVLFGLKGRTDELVILRRYHDQPSLGAIAGVELKKVLRWSAFYQAQAQWFLYAAESQFPYCQVTWEILSTYRQGSRFAQATSSGSL